MLTVMIASRNGARTLPRVLDSYLRLTEPAGGWKLIIVDNGSTDATLDILAGYADRLPLTFFSEPRLGKNVALNAALPHLEGDLAVFTDDDIMPSSGWLSELRQCADANPDFGIFGGPIRPAWDVAPPEWVVASVPQGPAFAVQVGKDGPSHRSSVIGGNMAIRAQAFREGRRFNEGIGPQGKNYLMGSETDFMIRLTAEGYKSWFCEKAWVEHIIRDYQLTRRWLVGRAYRWGRGQYVMHEDHLDVARWRGVPRWVVRTILEKGAEYVFNTIRLQPGKAFAARWEMAVAMGRAVEAHRSYVRRRRATPA